jgi:hypothetical protein
MSSAVLALCRSSSGTYSLVRAGHQTGGTGLRSNLPSIVNNFRRGGPQRAFSCRRMCQREAALADHVRAAEKTRL